MSILKQIKEKSTKNFKYYKSDKGITIVALVITTIVLLILSGVTISMTLSDNGIIEQAEKVKEETEKKQEQENLELAIAAALMAGSGEIKTENLQQKIDEFLGYGKLIEQETNWKYIVQDKIYNIDLEGKITEERKPTAEEILVDGQIKIDVEFVKQDGKIRPQVTITTQNIFANLKYKVKENEWIETISGAIITNTIEESKERDLTFGDTIYAILEYEGKQSEIEECIVPSAYEAGMPGLYDEYNNLLKTWEELEEMGLNIEEDHTTSNTEGTMYYLLNNDSTLKSNAKKIIIADIQEIGNYAFQNCNTLTEIRLPETVTRLGKSAFYNCNKLTEIILPKSITSIGEICFNTCKGLTSIIIPENLTTIGKDAFKACSNLNSITVSLLNSKYDSRENCNAIIETETNTLILGCNTTTIVDSITKIGDYAFYAYNDLAEIIIPESVTSAGSNVFYSCNKLEKISIPKTLTNIEDLGLTWSSYLKTAGPIGSGANIEFGWDKSIPNKAFYNCKYLTQIDIPATITTIGEYAFSYCNSLQEIIIPEGVTTIGRYAFRECSKITDIIIPKGVKSIKNSCFINCKSLTNITIPEEIVNIETSAFKNCAKLTSVTIDSASIASKLTSDTSCGNLINYATEIYIKEGITEIGSYITTETNYTIAGTQNGYVKYIKVQ